MIQTIKDLFSHGEGSHRESGLDNLFDIINDWTFGEIDCGA